MLRSIFKKKPVPLPAIPAGERVYAIGDIHGQDDALAGLLNLIAADAIGRGPARTALVLLGDLIDRGPDSRGVVERVMRLAEEMPDLVVLMGNHEEILLAAAQGARSSLALFNRVGGRETMLSYGVDPDRYEHADLEELAQLIADHVPAAHLAFLEAFGNVHRIGDYAFVHAGIRPGITLGDQQTSDLRWIREPFLSHAGPYEATIVHGHTITAEPDVRSNRIGIDTGAYAGGRLTALGLEGTERWFLSV